MEKNYRRCISCRKVAHKKEFWRIVRNHATDDIQLDEGMGRSAYLCPSATCLAIAQKKKRIPRALRAAIPQTVYDGLAQRLSC